MQKFNSWEISDNKRVSSFSQKRRHEPCQSSGKTEEKEKMRLLLHKKKEEDYASPLFGPNGAMVRGS